MTNISYGIIYIFLLFIFFIIMDIQVTSYKLIIKVSVFITKVFITITKIVERIKQGSAELKKYK